MHRQKLLMLRWRSFLGWGNEYVACHYSYKADHYIHIGRIWQCSPLIAKCVGRKIVDAPLTLTLKPSIQSSYSQYMYATNCTVIIPNQYSVSMYCQWHLEALWPLHFWSTTIHVIWVMDDVALSNSRALGWQLMACWSFHLFLINIAQLPQLSSSSSVFSISMTYHKQFETSQPRAPGLCGELCSWMHGWMHHDGRHSDRLVLNTDRSFYDMYVITHLNFVSKFGY